MFERLIVWGGKRDLASHRHIQRAFALTAKKMGIETLWLEDDSTSPQYVTPGSTVIAADVWAAFLPYVPGVDYVLHNFDGSHPICQQVKEDRLLRLQVWTKDALSGEEWDTCRVYNREARTLFQPWGTDLLAEEFLPPVFNPRSPHITFVGAIWGEASPYGELGNREAIEELKTVVNQHYLRFRHLTHVSDKENIDAVREARLAPTIAGGWQVEHGYLPCRAFKNASYGQMVISNVPEVQKLFDLPSGSVTELLESALALNQNQYEGFVRAHQRIAKRYTYRESLVSIARALEAGR